MPRGGYRKGAGRRPEYQEPVEKILLGLPVSALATLDHYARQLGVSRPKLILQLLELAPHLPEKPSKPSRTKHQSGGEPELERSKLPQEPSLSPETLNASGEEMVASMPESSSLEPSENVISFSDSPALDHQTSEPPLEMSSSFKSSGDEQPRAEAISEWSAPLQEPVPEASEIQAESSGTVPHQEEILPSPAPAGPTKIKDLLKELKAFKNSISTRTTPERK